MIDSLIVLTDRFDSVNRAVKNVESHGVLPEPEDYQQSCQFASEEIAESVAKVLDQRELPLNGDPVDVFDLRDIMISSKFLRILSPTTPEDRDKTVLACLELPSIRPFPTSTGLYLTALTTRIATTRPSSVPKLRLPPIAIGRGTWYIRAHDSVIQFLSEHPQSLENASDWYRAGLVRANVYGSTVPLGLSETMAVVNSYVERHGHVPSNTLFAAILALLHERGTMLARGFKNSFFTDYQGHPRSRALDTYVSILDNEKAVRLSKRQMDYRGLKKGRRNQAQWSDWKALLGEHLQ